MKPDSELEQAQIDKIRAEILKLTAEAVHSGKQARWYEVVIFTALGGALVAAGKLFL